jgi:hypothetical protein
MRPLLFAPLLLLLAVCLLALGAHRLRDRLGPGHRLEGEARLPSGSQVLIDDPDAAYHLRRVSIALASGAVPEFDQALNHPQGSAVPWPPSFDAFLARLAKGLLPERAEGALGGRSEADLERLLASLPPWLGALAALAVAWAASQFAPAGSGPLHRAGLALLAGALYAATPISIWYAGYGRIDHHVATALLLALALGAGQRALSARELAPALVSGSATGFALGIGLLCFLGSAVSVAGVLFALYLRAALAEGPGGRPLRFAGLLTAACATLAVAPAAEASPWNLVQPGSLINLSLGVPRALLAAALPFLALEVCARAGRSRAVGVGVSLVSVALAVVLLPGFLEGAREGFAWASRQNQFMDVVEESRPLLAPGWIGALRDLGAWSPAAPLLIPALLWMAWRGLAGAGLLLPQLLLLGISTLAQRRFGDAFAVPLAIGTSLVVVTGVRAGLQTKGARRAAAIFLAVLPLLALGTTLSGLLGGLPSADEVADLRAWRQERLALLQSLRDPKAAALALDPRAGGRGAVLSSWSLGHLIEYHGQRPTIATNFGSFVGEANFRAHAEALLERDPAALFERLLALDVVCLALTPRQCGELTSLARIAGYDAAQRAELFQRGARGKSFSRLAEQSALFQLALHDLEPGARRLALPDGRALELLARTARRETPDGRRAGPGSPGSGPALSLWRVIDPRRERSGGLRPTELRPLR